MPLGLQASLETKHLGETLAEARRRAYEAVGRIHFQGAFYRRDIAARALRPQK